MIKNLFLIGNGFDLSHKMHTSYLQFRDWLMEEFSLSENESSYYLTDPQSTIDGDEIIPDLNLAKFLLYCINEASDGESDENWANFESTLGKIGWEDFFDQVGDVKDEDGDTNYCKTLYLREDFSQILNSYSTGFPKLFSQWINTINYPDDISTNNFLSQEIQDSSFFITFNYTKTLEDIYKISEDQIFHIHGGDIIIGHGEKNKYDPNDCDFGMEGIGEIDEFLRKPTQKIIKQNANVFKQLKANFSITNIYSWGFSFSDVDQCYIQEICKCLDTEKITWYLHDFSQKNNTNYQTTLKNCGFKGTITTFHA